MLRSGEGRSFEVLSANLGNAEGKVETKKAADGQWQPQITIQPDCIQPAAAVAFKSFIELQETLNISIVRSKG